MEYIRKYYDVPAKRGARVKIETFYGFDKGTIVGSRNSYLRIRLDGENEINSYHPTSNIIYLEKGEKIW